MNVLFICNQNKNRSKKAEELFKTQFHTASAGLWNEHPVTKEQLLWADVLIVMDGLQQRELIRRFPKECYEKRLLTANIPDTYLYADPQLKEILTERISALLQPFIELA